MKNLVAFNDYVKLQENLETENVLLFEALTRNVEQIKNAIDNKLVCKIDYRGEKLGLVDSGIREIEPYAMGVNSRGNQVLRAWLIRGISRTGKIDPNTVPGWRLFRVDRIATVTPTLQTFTSPRKGYNSQDSKMTEVEYFANF